MYETLDSHADVNKHLQLTKVAATHPSLLQVAPVVTSKADGGKPVIWRCAEETKTFNLKETSQSEWVHVSLVYKGLDSYICVPLKADNRVVGVLELLNQTSETSFAFSKLDEQFLEAFGSLAAIAIEYVRDYRANVDFAEKSETMRHFTNTILSRRAVEASTATAPRVSSNGSPSLHSLS